MFPLSTVTTRDKHRWWTNTVSTISSQISRDTILENRYGVALFTYALHTLKIELSLGSNILISLLVVFQFFIVYYFVFVSPLFRFLLFLRVLCYLLCFLSSVVLQCPVAFFLWYDCINISPQVFLNKFNNTKLQSLIGKHNFQNEECAKRRCIFCEQISTIFMQEASNRRSVEKM